MRWRRLGTTIGLIALLAACGGGGSGGSPAPPPTSNQPTPPPPTSTGCTLRERQNWAFDQINEWYLFPETLPTSLDPSPFTTVQAYIDALTATARAQGRDRFFTFITSIAAENAFLSSGSTAGFGIRLLIDLAQQRVFITEAFEGAPALTAGIDRGAEILAIGTSTSDLRTVSNIIATEGAAGITNALGPSTPGTTRVLRISDANGVRDVTLTKEDFELLPVSPRYGVRIIDDGGRRVGYINLRTFISSAETPLRDAFELLRSQGITEIVIDYRYNGGGLVSTAELFGDFLGGNRTATDVFSLTVFRPSKVQFNATRLFGPQPQSVSPVRLAFIGTGSTASASELVINSFIPYLGDRLALVGANTFGKPVGQVGIDRPACDDRLRIVAFATQNRDGQGNYFSGLAGTIQASCQAPDDLTRQLGDPTEASVARSLDFLAQRGCTPITAVATTQALRDREAARLLTPDEPTAAQREVPGLF